MKKNKMRQFIWLRVLFLILSLAAVLYTMGHLRNGGGGSSAVKTFNSLLLGPDVGTDTKEKRGTGVEGE